MNTYIVPTRITIKANSEEEAKSIIKQILQVDKILTNGMNFSIQQPRKCTAFLRADEYLQSGYNQKGVLSK